MATPFAEASRFWFLDFELDGDTFELRRDGKLVPLRPQAATLLLLLVVNAGRLVSREEILEVVWGGDLEGDFEGSLHSCVRHVRAALGERADAPEMLQTFPRRGYRFDAAVTTESLSGPAPDAESAKTVSVSGPAGPRRGRLIAMAGLLLVVVTVMAALAMGGRRAGGWAGGAHVLAVEPFRVLSEDGGERFFGEGLSAELLGAIDALRSDDLVVLASGSDLRSPEGQGSAEGIARAGGATMLLSGLVRSTGDAVRVSVQLVRLSDGQQLWSHSYDGSRADALEVQRWIVEAIVVAVGLELAGRS